MIEIPKIDLRGRYYNIEDLRNLRKSLAKRANERLRQLERKEYERNAYTIAQRYISKTRGENVKRFNEGLMKSANLERLRSDLEELQAFLNAETSTIRGIKALEKRRVEFFRNRRDLQNGKESLVISDEKEFWDFISSEEFKNASKYASSDKLLELYDKAVTVDETTDRRNYEEFKEALKKYADGTIRTFTELEEEFDVEVL